MLCLQGHFPRISTQINHVFIGFIILSGSIKRKCVLKSKGFLFLIIMSYSHRSKCPSASLSALKLYSFNVYICMNMCLLNFTSFYENLSISYECFWNQMTKLNSNWL